jgi:predicted Zn-dependent protease
MFLIENGEIVGPVQNFRWNDGPARGFNNISMLGKQVPMHVGEAYDNPGTALVPAMKIEDFRMTSMLTGGLKTFNRSICEVPRHVICLT